jgi:signal transduction histidine kinase
LVAALERQAGAIRARHGLEVTTITGTEPNVAFDVKEAMYRVAQEALNNIVKHAHARRVEVHLHSEPTRLTLAVVDDGVGFVTDISFPGHLGLTSMRERVELVGGCLTLSSAPGAGTTVSASVAV